jgi:hypothetical protein
MKRELDQFPRRSPGIRPWLRPIVWRSPYLYWPIALIRQHKNILSRKYDILIDGFPRSANTFAVYAFRSLQVDAVRISHHHHNPAAVVAAVKARKPTLVLIRDPVDAIASWTISTGYPVEYSIECFIDYYRELLPHRDALVAANFYEITADLSAVIEMINQQFGTKFNSQPFEPEHAKLIFEQIENAHIKELGSLDERRIARPSTAREAFGLHVRRRIQSSELGALMSRARQVYDEFRLSSKRT